MHAMTLTAPPQARQVSISNICFDRWPQVIGAQRSIDDLRSSVEANTDSGE